MFELKLIDVITIAGFSSRFLRMQIQIDFVVLLPLLIQIKTSIFDLSSHGIPRFSCTLPAGSAPHIRCLRYFQLEIIFKLENVIYLTPRDNAGELESFVFPLNHHWTCNHENCATIDRNLNQAVALPPESPSHESFDPCLWPAQMKMCGMCSM